MSNAPARPEPQTDETIIFLHGGNMCGATWEGVAEHLPDRHLLMPDLPGYGDRAANEDWPGLPAAADDIAELIRNEAHDGKAHVVGLSTGGFTALHLASRHPELVRSLCISGVAYDGYAPLQKAIISPQARLWHRRWYWSVISLPFRLPKAERADFVAMAASASPTTNQRLLRDVINGTQLEPFDYDGPFLAVAAQHEGAFVRKAFPSLRKLAPQLQTWIAPRMIHPWSAQNPELFARMVATFADTGRWNGIATNQ